MNFKYLRNICFLTILLIGFTGSVYAQKPLSRLDRLKKVDAPAPKTNYNKYLKKSRNELQETGAVLFIGYKNYISSQDMGSCVFTPSCSVYAIESFQSDNPFVAYVKVFDRLSRCHPLTAKGEYPYYKKTAQLYDPVH